MTTYGKPYIASPVVMWLQKVKAMTCFVVNIVIINIAVLNMKVLCVLPTAAVGFGLHCSL